MFAGLIETTGIVSRADRVDGGAQIEIYAPEFGRDLAIGDSVLVDGACLTIAAFGRGSFTADISLETLDRTTVGHIRAQQKVNLERALRLSDRLGGQFVTGHVDGIGRLVQRHISGNATIYQFELPEHLMGYIVENGSLAINGVSLTVGRINENMIACSVVPVIEQRTTLSNLEYDEPVNVEIDMIAKYVRQFTVGFEQKADRFDDYNLEKEGNRMGSKLRGFLEG